jgi:hydroxymethylglutaryl-CoA synthase
VEGSLSYVTDTPDFWRRAYQHYPSHGGRFTGEPAYFKHITEAARALMEALGTTPADYDYAVFHQPNVKFPQTVARQLGFKPEQIQAGLLADRIGNTYAGSSLVGLTAVLDGARPGQRILLVSFGSGAGRMRSPCGRRRPSWSGRAGHPLPRTTSPAAPSLTTASTSAFGASC